VPAITELSLKSERGPGEGEGKLDDKEAGYAQVDAFNVLHAHAMGLRRNNRFK
jgi:hypothetical protein